jgi:oxygen-dependent protoporphyrinogen oxidase
MKSFGVFGGGITGLSALHTLKRRVGDSQHRVKLYERSKRIGGWMDTSSKSFGQSGGVHMFEKGPRSMRAAEKGEASLVLISQVPNLPSRLVSSSEVSSTRLLYLNGQVTPLPSSLLGLVSSPVTRKFIPVGINNFFANRAPLHQDESIASFFEAHMGKEFTREILAGVVVGIFGGSIDKLSINACFPSISRVGRDYGSLVRGFLLKSKVEGISKRIMKDLACTDEERRAYEALHQKVWAARGVFTFEGGVQAFPQGLASMHSKDIVTSGNLVDLDVDARGGMQFMCEGSNSPIHLDSAVSAIPAFELSKILRKSSPTASGLLSEIEYVNMAVVSAAFEEKPGSKIIPNDKLGFGYLVPPKANKSILGVSFDSITFPDASQPNLVRMAIMIGGDLSNNAKACDVSTASHESLLKTAIQSLREDLGITADPVSTSVNVALNAIPQYTVGHLERVEKIRATLAKDLPHLHIAGASYDGVGINDCVVSGIDAAVAALSKL